MPANSSDHPRPRRGRTSRAPKSISTSKGTSGSSVIRSFIGSNEFGKVVSPVVRSYLSIHGTYPPTAATITDGVAALRQGRTAAEIADGFARDTKIQALSDEQFVTQTYRFVFKRDPSGAELAADVKKLQAGNAQVPVVISGDKAVKYEAVVTAMDRLQKAGVLRVGLSVRQGG